MSHDAVLLAVGISMAIGYELYSHRCPTLRFAREEQLARITFLLRLSLASSVPLAPTYCLADGASDPPSDPPPSGALWSNLALCKPLAVISVEVRPCLTRGASISLSFFVSFARVVRFVCFLFFLFVFFFVLGLASTFVCSLFLSVIWFFSSSSRLFFPAHFWSSHVLWFPSHLFPS